MNDENSYSVANISGDILAPNLNGVASFKPYKDGTMEEVEISGLPGYNNYGLYQIEINNGSGCMINQSGSFSGITSIYNPTNSVYPFQSGDMPPLFSNNGYAYMKFYTTRFKYYEIEGRLVVIKSNNRKIGCGKIEKYA